MRIEEADPVTKGQTASSSYKPARLENGVRVMVPPHVESGTRIVVNTTDNSYVERAKD
jgi:elongation factor P